MLLAARGDAQPQFVNTWTAAVITSQDVQPEAYLPSPRFISLRSRFCCCHFVFSLGELLTEMYASNGTTTLTSIPTSARDRAPLGDARCLAPSPRRQHGHPTDKAGVLSHSLPSSNVLKVRCWGLSRLRRSQFGSCHIRTCHKHLVCHFSHRMRFTTKVVSFCAGSVVRQSFHNLCIVLVS